MIHDGFLRHVFDSEKPHFTSGIDELGVCGRGGDEVSSHIGPGPCGDWGKLNLVVVVGGKAAEVELDNGSHQRSVIYRRNSHRGIWDEWRIDHRLNIGVVAGAWVGDGDSRDDAVRIDGARGRRQISPAPDEPYTGRH